MTSVLSVVDVAYRYPKAAAETPPVLNGITFNLEGGERLGVFGNNGSGKSTLLKIAASLLRPERGEIRFEGQLLRRSLARYRGSLNYCSGAPLGFYPRLTAQENLRFFSGMKGRMLRHDEIVALLAQVGLDDSIDVTYARFSLGMRQRLHLASLLFEPASIWILDEPTNGLDQDGMKLLHDMLDRATSKAVLIVSHDHQFLSRVASRTVLLKGGVLTCSDLPSS